MKTKSPYNEKAVLPPKSCFCVGPQNGEELCPCMQVTQQSLNIFSNHFKEMVDAPPDIAKAIEDNFWELFE